MTKTVVLVSVHKTKAVAKKAAEKKRNEIKKGNYKHKYRITVRKGPYGYSVLAHPQ